MRALILSDVHANLEALEAVLDASPEHDVVWNLGDVAGYGAAPNEVIDRVRRLGKCFVRGNHDRACSGQLSLSGFNPIAGCAARWTQKVLTLEHLEWLQNLEPGPVTPAGAQVSCMHGSYLEDWFDLKPVYASADQGDVSELILREGARYMINPGAVGQPRDGDWRAAFALYDDERRMVEFHRVPYDLRTAQMRIMRAGLPDFLASRLRDGR